MMTELEKLEAGQEYCFFDEEVEALKKQAVKGCDRFNQLDALDFDAQTAVLRELLGATGKRISVQPGFHCDNGKNIHVGEEFSANYHVTILDIAPVHIGDYCMIGPNVLITTVGHPHSPAKRRNKIAQAWPVRIGDDVWIGGNAVILPGITIGNNVIVAAGAVVTKDVPDNCVVGGIPARKIKDLADDVDV